jgi:hypothetical protein
VCLGEGEGGGKGGYLSDMAVPILCPDADFDCFLHEPCGDDDCVDGSLCCAGRHDCFQGARQRAIVEGEGLSYVRARKFEVSAMFKKLRI